MNLRFLQVSKCIGRTLAVGASQHNAAAGLVRIYKYDAGAWRRIQQDIEGKAAGDQFGISVDITGDGRTFVGGGDFGV